MSKNILVTGASSGFGLLIANELHRKGYNVIGTSRNPEKIKSKVPFKTIALDLDLDESINTLPERIFKEDFLEMQSTKFSILKIEEGRAIKR